MILSTGPGSRRGQVDFFRMSEGAEIRASRATGVAREENKNPSGPKMAVEYKIVSGQEAKLTSQTHFPVGSTRTLASLQVSFPRWCLRKTW
jgi:hypothetical protein